MSLIKTGQGITDIRGGLGGVYFTRDKSGLHSSAKPRRVHQLTDAQKKQRNAFIAARALSKDNRVVSYLMYRYMNGLPIKLPPEWMSPVNFVPSDWLEKIDAFDTNLVTNAYFVLNPLSESPFLTLTQPGMYSDKIRFDVIKLHATKVPVDVDGCLNGEWINIYPTEDGYGNDYNDHTWTFKPFVKGLLTQERIRFRNDHLFDVYVARIFEVEIWNLHEQEHVPVPADYQIPKL